MMPVAESNAEILGRQFSPRRGDQNAGKGSDDKLSYGELVKKFNKLFEEKKAAEGEWQNKFDKKSAELVQRTIKLTKEVEKSGRLERELASMKKMLAQAEEEMKKKLDVAHTAAAKHGLEKEAEPDQARKQLQVYKYLFFAVIKYFG